MTFDEYIGMHSDSSMPWNTAVIHIEDHHCNPTGNINGGVLISLADNLSTAVAGRAYKEKTGEQRFMVGVDLHAVLLANQRGGAIRAVAEPVRVGRRITVIRTDIIGDGDQLLAQVTTTHVPT